MLNGCVDVSLACITFYVLVIIICAVYAQQPCSCNTSEVWDTLMSLYTSTQGPRWLRSDHWGVSGSSVCEWYGVSKNCTQILLAQNSLNGTLPTELAFLTTIVQFDVGENSISGTLSGSYDAWTRIEIFCVEGNVIGGTLPREYASWVSLRHFLAASNLITGTLPVGYASWGSAIRVFDVSGNLLSGGLPPEYKEWKHLTKLIVSGNALSGTFSTSYSSYTSLQIFDVKENQFVGTLPMEYAVWTAINAFSVEGNIGVSGTLCSMYHAWTNLTLFHAGRTTLTGTLPKEYEQWQTIRVFSVGHARLNGSLPAEYKSWSKIQFFAVPNNTLTGTLPREFGHWTQLERFAVSDNVISGTLPPEYSSWTKLHTLHAMRNFLSGTLPPIFGSWTAMQEFCLGGNLITGSVPSSFSAMTSLKTLGLENNHLSGTVPRLPQSFEVIGLHNNRDLSGPLPLGMGIVWVASVCNTSLCGALPQNWLFSQFVCQDLVVEALRNMNAAQNLSMMGFSTSPSSLPSCSTTRIESPPTSNVSQHNQSSVPYNSRATRSAVGSTEDAAVGSMATLNLLVGSSSAMATRRTTLHVFCGVSASAVLASSVDFSNAPLQLELGSWGAWHRGAVVGNIAFVSCVACIAAAAVAVLRQVRQRKGAHASWRSAAGTLRLPSSLGLVVLPLYQQTLQSSVLLLSEINQSPDVSVDVALGCVGVLAAAAWYAVLVLHLLPWFSATSLETNWKRRFRGFRRHAAWLLLPIVEWKADGGKRRLPGCDRHARKLFVSMYGLWFGGNASRRHWWLVADVSVTIVSCVVTGVVPETDTECAAQRWALVVIAGACFAAAAVLRPKNRRLNMLSVLVSNGVSLGVSVCAALGVERTHPALAAATTFAASFGLLATVVIRVGSFVLLRREHRKASTGKDRTSSSTQQRKCQDVHQKSKVPALSVSQNDRNIDAMSPQSCGMRCDVQILDADAVSSAGSLLYTRCDQTVQETQLRDLVALICERQLDVL